MTHQLRSIGDRIQDVKSRIDLRDFINLGQPKKNMYGGRRLFYCCPFHNEKTASFCVEDDHYHCYGCSTHGDVIDWMRYLGNMSVLEAVEALEGDSKLYTAPIPRKPKDEKPKVNFRPIETLDEYLAHQASILPYMEKRGLNADTIRYHKIGGQPYTRVYWLKGTRIEFTCNRVVIPYLWNNQVMALEFRRDDLSCEQYLERMPEQIRQQVFDDIKAKHGDLPHKDILDILFGLRYWQPPSDFRTVLGADQLVIQNKGILIYRKVSSCLVTEGPIDAISLMQEGFVAISAKYNRNFNLGKLLQNVRLKYILADNDKSGWNQAVLWREALGGQRNDAWCIQVPDPHKDANDMLIKKALVRWFTNAPLHLSRQILF